MPSLSGQLRHLSQRSSFGRSQKKTGVDQIRTPPPASLTSPRGCSSLAYPMASTPQELSKIYHRRFIRTAAYRNRVWQVLTREFFSRWVAPDAVVLDLGCGYGEFINNIPGGVKEGRELA